MKKKYLLNLTSSNYGICQAKITYACVESCWRPRFEPAHLNLNLMMTELAFRDNNRTIQAGSK